MKKLFNIKLPEDLKVYLATQAERTYTTMTQYIINLIVQDKEKYEQSQRSITDTNNHIE